MTLWGVSRMGTRLGEMPGLGASQREELLPFGKAWVLLPQTVGGSRLLSSTHLPTFLSVWRGKEVQLGCHGLWRAGTETLCHTVPTLPKLPLEAFQIQVPQAEGGNG